MKRFFPYLVLIVSHVLNAQFDQSDRWDGEQYNKHSDPQFKNAMKIVDPIPIPSRAENWLDLGCGSGRVSVELAKKNSLGLVIGVDASESQIAKARQQSQEQKNLSFMVADGQNLSFQKQFDRIFSFAAIHWMPNKEKVFKGCFEALKPGGLLLLTMKAKDPEAFLKKALIKTTQEAGPEPEWAVVRTINPEKLDNSLDTEELKTHLITSGFKILEIRPELFGDRFTPSEFKGFLSSLIGAFGALGELKAKNPEFVNKVLDMLVKNYSDLSPVEGDGKLDYHVKGLFALVEKPEN